MQLRKDQSIASVSTEVVTEGKVGRSDSHKMRIASHSPFHLSVVFLSSSSDLSRYTENRASDVSADLGCPDGSPRCSSSGRSGG